MNEYCEARPSYSSNSDSGSSYESTEETNEEKYDYPLVDPQDFGQMKRRFLQDAGAMHPITTEGDATYCRPPEFFDPTFKPELKGQLPSRPSLRKVTSSSFHQHSEHTSAAVIPGGKASVDVSRVLKSEVSLGGVVHNKVALNVAEILKQAPKPTVRKRPSETVMASPPAIHRPVPVAKPRIKTALSTASSSSSTECLSTEEMYLELSNDPVEEPFSRQSTLQRMRGDGDSFKVKDNETTKQAIDVLPPTALRLDYTRTDAIPLLIGYEGAYMIHSSSKGDINQALSVCIQDKVRHFLIFCNKDGYALDPKGLRFMSIESMIQHFSVKPLPNQESARLRVPYN